MILTHTCCRSFDRETTQKINKYLCPSRPVIEPRSPAGEANVLLTFSEPRQIKVYTWNFGCMVFFDIRIHLGFLGSMAFFIIYSHSSILTDLVDFICNKQCKCFTCISVSEQRRRNAHCFNFIRFWFRFPFLFHFAVAKIICRPPLHICLAGLYIIVNHLIKEKNECT